MKIKKHSKNSIWTRLRRSFILVLVLPILTMGSYMVYSSIQYVKSEKIQEAKKLVEQSAQDLNNRMEQCENSLIYLASNYTLQEFLQMDTTNYRKLNEAAANIGPLLYNVLLSNQYYKKVWIYTDKDFIVRTDLMKNSGDVEGQPWYENTLDTKDTCWWNEDGKIWITRKIAAAYPRKTLGVLYAEIKPEMFEGIINIFEEIPVRMELNDTYLLYQSDAWANGYFQETQALLPQGWELGYQIDKEYFYPGDWMTVAFPLGLIFLVLMIAGVIIWIVLKVLLNEMDDLVSQVGEVRAGNLNVELTPVRTEELNILVEGINGMLQRIRQLIQKVYQDESEQKELELEVLQSKISPHFLYNNLSAINWLAIEREQDDIYEITTQMATFYRTALNKGKKTDKLQLEITNIKAYIQLQLISHENSFDVEYEIDEKVLADVVPTFILQPLVENALEHGTDLLREKRGRIIIRAYEEDGSLYLEVEDNGEALYEEIGAGTLDISRYGYGTGNVHRRIQLMYGEKYGLTVSASEKGTLSRMKLKAGDINISI